MELAQLFKQGKIILRGDSALSNEEFQAYGSDRSNIAAPGHRAVAFPQTTQEVSDLVKFAAAQNIPLVPSGGRTGYSGGAAALDGEIVVSLARMNRVISFDSYLPSLTVQAGMITADLQREAKERGFYFPVDFAAAGSSMVGGNIATNAGGIHVVRYGSIRSWVSGFTVVTGGGETLELRSDTIKNNTGYDLKQLFIGSEGTLGIITEAQMRLCRPPGETRLALFGLSTFDGVLAVFREVFASSRILHAMEFFDAGCLAAVRRHMELPDPFGEQKKFYTLVEFESSSDISNDFSEDFIHRLLIADPGMEAIQAQNSAQKAGLWKYRESISESLGMLHKVYKFDIAIPLDRMESFIGKSRSLLPAGVQPVYFGHLADGNIHMNLLKSGDVKDSDFLTLCKNLEREIFSLVRELSGSVSAEHGIGLLKKEALPFSRSQAQINLMREIKKVFDPVGIMNPGKIF